LPEFLPILRGVFANYSKPERTQMLSIAKSGSESSKTLEKVGLDRKFATEI
jgi:hypothetical protein